MNSGFQESRGCGLSTLALASSSSLTTIYHQHDHKERRRPTQPKERGQERNGELSKANEVKDSHDCGGKEWGDKNEEYFEDSNPPLSVQLQCEPYMQL